MNSHTCQNDSKKSCTFIEYQDNPSDSSKQISINLFSLAYINLFTLVAPVLHEFSSLATELIKSKVKELTMFPIIHNSYLFFKISPKYSSRS